LQICSKKRIIHHTRKYAAYQAGIALEKEDINYKGRYENQNGSNTMAKILSQDLSNHFLTFFQNLWDDCLHTWSLVKTNQGG